MHIWLGIFHSNQTFKCLRKQSRTKGKGWSTAYLLKPPVNSLLAISRQHFCFSARFTFCVLIVLFLLFVVVFLSNQSRTKWESLSTATSASPPVISLLANSRRLLFDLFDLLECPVMLMTLILVIRFWQQNLSQTRIKIS